MCLKLLELSEMSKDINSGIVMSKGQKIQCGKINKNINNFGKLIMNLNELIALMTDYM